MIKRKNLILLMAVIAIAVLFTSTAVMAVFPEPPPIYTGPPKTTKIVIPKGGTYTITAEVEKGVDCAGGVLCDEYRLVISNSESSTLSGLNAVYLTTPRWADDGVPTDQSRYCSEPLDILEVFPAWQQNQNTNVLYNLSGRDVMQWTQQETDNTWRVRLSRVDEDDLVPGTVCVKHNNNIGCGAILVFDCSRPDCEEPPYTGIAASTATQCLNIGTGGEVLSASFKTYTTGLYAGAVDQTTLLFHPGSTDCTSTGVEGTDEALGDNSDYCMGAPGERKGCWRKASASPGCYTNFGPFGITTYCCTATGCTIQ